MEPSKTIGLERKVNQSLDLFKLKTTKHKRNQKPSKNFFQIKNNTCLQCKIKELKESEKQKHKWEEKHTFDVVGFVIGF